MSQVDYLSARPLADLLASDQISRRQFLRRATALGLSAPAIAALLAACGGSGSSATATTAATSAAAASTKAPTVIGSGSGAAASPASAASATTASSTGGTSPATPAAALKPPGKDQTLVYAMNSPFRTLDPAGATETGSIDVTHACYEGLVASVPRSADIEPRLAKSWDVTDGAQVITFHLQQGVKFQDGTTMDANAVKFSFERVLQLNLGNAGPITGIDKIEVADPATVRFTLKEPNVYFVSNCTQIGIISPTAVQQHDKGGDMAAAWLEEGHTAGTGPYMMTEYQKNTTGTIEKFADYWQGWSQPHLTKIVWPIVPEATTRRQMLEKGQAQVVANLTLEDAKALEPNPALAVLYIRAFNTWTMPLNLTKPPLDNVKVREAIQLAFDYQGYLDQVWLGHGVIGNGPVASGFPGYVKDAPVFKQDLDKAKQLLAEAGASNTTLDCAYIDSSPEEKQSAVILQDALKKIGLDLKLTAMPWATMFKLAGSPDTDPHMTNRQVAPTRPDPAFFLQWYYGSPTLKVSNWGYNDNKQANDLINQARAAADLASGTKLLEQAAQLLIADHPTLWYSQPDRYYTMSNRVQNFSPITVGYPNEMVYWAMYLSD